MVGRKETWGPGCSFQAVAVSLTGKTCRDKTEHVLPSLLVFGSHSLAAAMMPSQHFLIQRNLANYLFVVLITHLLNIVFTRFRVFCMKAENGQVMTKKRCWGLGKILFFNETGYSWGRMRIQKKRGGGGEGKNQMRIKGKKEKEEARRSPDLLKRLAKFNFFGRSNGTASPESFRKWNEAGKQNWPGFYFLIMEW